MKHFKTPSVLLTARHAIKRFSRDTNGAALVEFALCLPLLLVFLAAAVVLQDAIRMGYINEKASYTLGDMASREDESIDAGYFDGLASIQQFMISSRYPADLRMTVLECTANCANEETRVLEVCWSESSPNFGELTTDTLAGFSARAPLFASGDTLLMTEAYLDYTPPAFTRFFDGQRYEAINFMRPRLASQIKFDTGATDADGETIFRDCFNNDV